MACCFVGNKTPNFRATSCLRSAFIISTLWLVEPGVASVISTLRNDHWFEQYLVLAPEQSRLPISTLKDISHHQKTQETVIEKNKRKWKLAQLSVPRLLRLTVRWGFLKEAVMMFSLKHSLERGNITSDAKWNSSILFSVNYPSKPRQLGRFPLLDQFKAMN